MTAIAGVVEGGKVWIGADSAGVDSYLSLSIRADEKVFKVGPFLFGFAGSFRCANIVKYKLEPPVQVEGLDDHEYLCTSFVDSLRVALENGGALRKSDETGNVEELDADLLVGYRGGLWVIEADFQVGASVDGFNAIGCGRDLVLGALYASSDMDPKPRITQALKAAERYSAGVRGPFKILSI